MSYEAENELAVGKHEIQVRATDSSGNTSGYAKKTFAVAGMPQISGVAVPEQYQDGVDIKVIVDGYAIHCVEANVTAVKTDKTEVDEVYVMNQVPGKREKIFCAGPGLSESKWDDILRQLEQEEKVKIK